nr:MAG TPA: hypothetical protein [Caudoviricetes sp.]DAK59245.1 MAG TPA: hypothetical protein [Caudoviricetes sp.]
MPSLFLLYLIYTFLLYQKFLIKSRNTNINIDISISNHIL